jgi:CMP-N,N'-diacetyllegionaminic acid synthase
MSKQIYVDIDDTICYYEGDNKLDYYSAKPDYNRIKIVNELYDRGHHIVMYTARGTKMNIDWSDLTETQLKEWGVKYHELKFGKPAYDLLIDDKTLTCLEQIHFL